MAAGNKQISVAVDAVVFGYSAEDGVSVLLIRRKYEPFKQKWALPGGFVQPDESLETSVQRELQEEAGIRVQYLEQLYSFGKPDRDPRRRIISITYFAVVRSSLYSQLKASTDADSAQWFPMQELPALAFDHRDILRMAVERLRLKMRYEPIGFELLDRRFPFSHLEKLYTVLLGHEIDRRNFSKKIMALGILDETGEFASREGKGRPAKLYEFNRKRYRELLASRTYFEI